MKILFTGGSGFLGQSIIPLLKKEYLVKSIGIGDSDDIKNDLSKTIPELTEKFDIVLHAAGKAHVVPNSSKESMSFFKINVEGTRKLCKALENNVPDVFIFISTVAVYGIEFGNDIDENSALNGTIPYAKSKIEAELFLQEWCNFHKVKLAILRPALLAGKNPPGNLGAMINGLKTGKYFRIGDGSARKSILMAEDIFRILPKLLKKGGVYNLCDNHHPSFYELEELIVKQLNFKSPKTLPFWLAKSIAKMGDLFGAKAPINSSKLNKITQSLTFSNEKAKRELDWKPLDVLENFKLQ